MTSLEFFKYSTDEAAKPSVDWGTGELQSTKFDPTIIQAPTYLLKNQPINQYYRESNLELSNVRLNDQLVPSPFEVDIKAYQINRPFPMMHPSQSQTSYKALFPDYIAPEDPKQGDLPPHSIISEETAAQIDPTIIVKKVSGNAWRHELTKPTLPTQRLPATYPEKEYYQEVKPDLNHQQFYPSPPSSMVPNHKMRSAEQTLEKGTANILRNKDKEHHKTTHQLEYYKDGLGSAAPLNSDNTALNINGYNLASVNKEQMNPYFRRGDGLTKFTSETIEPNPEKEPLSEEAAKRIIKGLNKSYPAVMTKREIDYVELETGKDYKNFPEANYTNNPKVPTFVQRPGLPRAYTLPNIEAKNKALEAASRSEKNVNESERVAMLKDHQTKIQDLEMINRLNDVERITADRDVRLMRLKQKELSNIPNKHPDAHINLLYAQESKYLGERADLYRTQVYNPYLLKQYNDDLKPLESSEKQFVSQSLSLLGNKKNHVLPNDSYAHRPKLFADKVFSNHKDNRQTKENLLNQPMRSASAVVQENGFILKQSTYGQSYNTKKYLQENNHVSGANENQCKLVKFDQKTLEEQDVTLKSQLQNGEKSAQGRTMYPRVVGPVPPEPYETLYCVDKHQINEHSDGYSKRVYSRVYDSPFKDPNQRYLPLKSDVEALEKLRQSSAKNDAEKQINQTVSENLNNHLNQININDESQSLVARVDNNERLNYQINGGLRQSTYQAEYLPFHYAKPQDCPPNQFYKNLEYTQMPNNVENRYQEAIETLGYLPDAETMPRDLVQLHDRWSKTQAHRRFHSSHRAKTADLRHGIHTGKKIIKDSPANAARLYIEK